MKALAYLESQCAFAMKGTTSSVMIASRPEVSFRPDDSSSPGNYGCLPYVLTISV
jgi:hypothetical protein